MALNPIPFAFVSLTAYIFQILMFGSGEVSVEFPSFEFGGSIVSFFTGAFESIAEVIHFMARFLTFSFLGMPWFLGLPIAVALNGSILWAGFELARGT